MQGWITVHDSRASAQNNLWWLSATYFQLSIAEGLHSVGSSDYQGPWPCYRASDRKKGREKGPLTFGYQGHQPCYRTSNENGWGVAVLFCLPQGPWLLATWSPREEGSALLEGPLNMNALPRGPDYPSSVPAHVSFVVSFNRFTAWKWSVSKCLSTVLW